MKRMKKRFWYLSSLGVALALGLGWATIQAKRDRDASVGGDSPVPAAGPRHDQSARAPVYDFAGSARPFRGSEDALVTVVEFTDYQCPFCTRHFQQTYPRLIQEYGGRIKYVVRNFPLVQIHRDAAKAAEGAECAFDQGRFWEYHDRLFANNTALDFKSLKRYAEAVGLDTLRFNECLDSGKKSRVVELDMEDGRRFGVRGTPTFFINGRILIGAQPFEIFRYYIDAALLQEITARK